MFLASVHVFLKTVSRQNHKFTNNTPHNKMTISISKNVGSYMNLPVNKQTITCQNMSHSKQFTTATFEDLKTIEYICGNKMPTRCNRGFYCRSYCLLNMFRAPLRPSSGAQEYHTVVAACGISCCGFQVAGLVWS